MTSKNNRALLLHYVKLCASFQIHRWIQTGVTVRKHSIQVEIGDLLSRDLEIWWMTLENNRAHLLYYIKLCASFEIHRCQTWITVRKRSIRVRRKSAIFCPVWPWYLTADLEKRAHLLSCFKLCASFHSHWWIQTGVRIRKRSVELKIDEFFNRVTLKFDGWPWKTIGHLF